METTGRTVREALDAALDELGVDEQDAEVVVVEEPRNGLFGLRRSTARIRARVRPTAPRPKRPQRQRRSRSEHERGGDGQPARRDESAGEGTSAEGATGRRATRGGPEGTRPSRGRRTGPRAAEPGGSGSGSGAEAQAEEDGSRSGGGRRQRGAGAGTTRQDRETPGSGAEELVGVASGGRSAGADGGSGVGRVTEESASGSPAKRRRRRRGRGGRGGEHGDVTGVIGDGQQEGQMSVEEQATAAEAFVRGVVERFSLRGTTAVQIEPEQVLVTVNGDDLGLLVGPRGSTLEALQELTRTVVQRRGEEYGTRVNVDVAGYRAKRAAALREFVERVAAEVVATGEARALEPMAAPDRKIVHDAANEVDGVETTSEGTDPHRYVVIRPVSSAGAPTATSSQAGSGPGSGPEVDGADPDDDPDDEGD